MNAYIMTVDGNETVAIPADFRGQLGPMTLPCGARVSREMRTALAVASEDGAVYGTVEGGIVVPSTSWTGRAYRNPARIGGGGEPCAQG